MISCIIARPYALLLDVKSELLVKSSPHTLNSCVGFCVWAEIIRVALIINGIVRYNSCSRTFDFIIRRRILPC